MQVVWLALIGVSGAPLVYVALLVNPLTLLVLGADRWRARLLGLSPYRRWIVLAFAVFCLSTAVYTIRYG